MIGCMKHEGKYGEEIGKKIKYQRVKAGLSQERLGTMALKIKPSTAQGRIKTFESPKGRIPTEKELKQICEVLNITMDDLIESQKYEEPPVTFPCDGICIPNKLLKNRPAMKNYLNMLISAIEQDDLELTIIVMEKAVKIMRESLKKEKQNL